MTATPMATTIRVISAAEVPPSQGTVEFTDDTITFTPNGRFRGRGRDHLHDLGWWRPDRHRASITVTVNDVPEAPVTEDDTADDR